MSLTTIDKIKYYKNLLGNIDVEDIRNTYPNISKEDVDMCISSYMFDICENLRFGLIDATNGTKDIKSVAINSLSILKEEFFDKFKYYLINQREYNKTFREKKKQFEQKENCFENPFYVTIKVFNSQFENLDKESVQDILTKTLFYSNKATKELEAVKENLLQKIVRNDNDLSMIKKIEYKCGLQSIDEEEKGSLKEEYILEYQNYLADEISREELEQTKAYRMMENLLDKQRNNGLNISHEQMYKYLSLNTSIRNIYLLKDICIEQLVSLYAKQENKGDLEIYHHEEESKENRLNKSTNNVVLSIISKDSNTPIKVHCSSALLKDFEQTYSAKIPEGNINLDYKNLFYIKYNEKQKRQIEVLNGRAVKSRVDSDVSSYIETQYNMCNNLDKLNIEQEQDYFEL